MDRLPGLNCSLSGIKHTGVVATHQLSCLHQDSRQLMTNQYKICRLKFEWIILFCALVLRIWMLDIKPPHFDEGINGWFADRVREQGFYAYDPTNYHGPLYFYVLFVMQTLFGRALWALRLPAVLGSVMSVWMAFRFDRFLGRPASYWGAVALAVSPAMVFYGRYAIHEAWVALSLMILVWGLLSLCQRGDRRSLFVSFLGGALLLLLKETAVIHMGVLFFVGIGLLIFVLTSKKLHIGKHFLAKQSWQWSDFLIANLLSLLVLLFFYSGGFLNMHGFVGLFETLPAWIHTGVKTAAHVKPEYQWGIYNYYWLALMSRYEWPSLLGFSYSCYCCIKYIFLKKENRLSFFNIFLLSCYGLLTFVIYSAIPYKTPWCLISILWPFALLFGVLVGKIPWGKTRVFIGTTMLFVSLCLCMRLNFWRYADFKEPYVYVQTSPEIVRLTEPLLAMAKKDPRNFHLHGQILLESYFPIPWILGDFTSIAYFSKETLPKKYDGDFIVVERSRSDTLEKQLKEPYYRVEFLLRDAMEKCVVYFKTTTFQNLFEAPGEQQKYFFKKVIGTY